MNKFKLKNIQNLKNITKIIQTQVKKLVKRQKNNLKIQKQEKNIVNP